MGSRLEEIRAKLDPKLKGLPTLADAAWLLARLDAARKALGDLADAADSATGFESCPDRYNPYHGADCVLCAGKGYQERRPVFQPDGAAELVEVAKAARAALAEMEAP